MTILIGILIGLFAAWLASKVGFFDTLTVLFNMITAAYTAIFLRSTVVGLLDLGQGGYSTVIALVAVGGGTFAILYGISFLLITGQFKVTFPKIMDISLGSITGFLMGLLIWSFIALVICAAPFSQSGTIKAIGFDSEKMSFSYISFWGDFVNTFAGSSDNDKSTKEMIGQIFSEIQEQVEKVRRADDIIRQPTIPDANDVVEPPEEKFDPPPEIDFDEL
ncbi:MAG: CvpA family protein [Planctomycetota bacterium]|jgi:hypothetical protein